MVLDGWGHTDNTEYNAIHSAHKPIWDDLWAVYAAHPDTVFGHRRRITRQADG